MSNLPPFTLPGSTPEPTGPEATEPVAPPVDESNPVVDSEEAVFAAAVEAALGRRVDSGSDPSATGIPAPEAGEGGVGGEPVEGLAPADSATDDGTNPLIPTGGPITEGVDDGSGSTSTPTTPDPTADLIDLGDGRVASKAELADLYAWANSLTPAQQQRIIQATSVPDPLYPQSAASGSGTPAPVLPASSVPGVGSPASYPPAGYPAAGQPGVPVTPESNRLDARTALGEMADLVPGLATYLEQVQADQAQLNAELASYRQQQALTMQQQAEAEQSRIQSGIAQGHEAFVSAHPELEATDLHYLQSEALSAGLIAPLMAKHGNDPTAAYQAALETIMWSTPKYRDQIVQQQASIAAAQQAQMSERRDNAAALAGSGGSVSRGTQTAPASSMNSEQRAVSLREAIAQAIQN